MVKQKKMIVKELAPKMKIIREIKTELQEEAAPEEVSLEEITSNAPSSREFPSLSQQEVPIAPQEVPEIPKTITEAREEEKPASQMYAIQRNVTEKDIAKSYETRAPEPLRAGAAAERRNPLILTERERREEAFRNREVGALRAQEGEEEDKYTITPNMQHSSKEKKYPWEA